MRRLPWVALGVGLLGLAAPALSADPPGPTGSARPDHAHQRLRAELERRAATLASALPLPSSSVAALPSSSVAALPSGSAVPLPGGVMKLEELARRWRERAATRDERRARHRAQLLQQLGTNLGVPAVKAELELHARRVAELSRVEFLARHARAGAQREALLARVARLTEKENRRHQQALAKLLGAAPSASSGGAVPAPTSSGVSH